MLISQCILQPVTLSFWKYFYTIKLLAYVLLVDELLLIHMLLTHWLLPLPHMNKWTIVIYSYPIYYLASDLNMLYCSAFSNTILSFQRIFMGWYCRRTNMGQLWQGISKTQILVLHIAWCVSQWWLAATCKWLGPQHWWDKGRCTATYSNLHLVSLLCCTLILPICHEDHIDW